MLMFKYVIDAELSPAEFEFLEKQTGQLSVILSAYNKDKEAPYILNLADPVVKAIESPKWAEALQQIDHTACDGSKDIPCRDLSAVLKAMKLPPAFGPVDEEADTRDNSAYKNVKKKRSELEQHDL